MRPVITLTKEGKRSAKLIEELPDRAKAFQEMFVYLAAEKMLDDLLARIPTSPEWEAYRKSLDVARVESALPAFAVRVNSQRSGVRDIDASTTVLYVQPRRRMAQPSPGVAVLEQHSPWTLDSLPFTPKRNEARVVTRKVTRREVEQVRRDRRKDRRQWRRELERQGVRLKSRDQRTRSPQTTPDVAFEGLRLEFGAGGKGAKPHWRPAIKRLSGKGILSVFRANKELEQALTKASFRGWRNWPGVMVGRMTESEAQKLIPFAQRLGVV